MIFIAGTGCALNIIRRILSDEYVGVGITHCFVAPINALNCISARVHF